MSQVSSLDVRAWRANPTSVAEEPNDPGKLRIVAARGRLFDLLIGNDSPLDRIDAQNAETSLVRSQRSMPEFPVASSSVVVSATFLQYKIHLSESKRSIYTELLFSVDQIHKDVGGSLHHGDLISVLKPGGSLRFADGHTKYYALADNTDLFSPGAKYKLFLNYDSATDSYWVLESWLVFKGSVFPNSPDDIGRDKSGTLEHLRQTEPQFDANLRKKSQVADQH